MMIEIRGGYKMENFNSNNTVTRTAHVTMPQEHPNDYNSQQYMSQGANQQMDEPKIVSSPDAQVQYERSSQYQRQPQYEEQIQPQEPQANYGQAPHQDSVQQVEAEQVGESYQPLILDDGEFELPMGYIDNLGQLHKTIRLKKMNGEAEEAISDPKVRDNGGKLVTELIFNVTEKLGTLPHINKDIIRGLSVPDRDFILVKNKQYSLGDVAHFVQACPYCKGKNEVSVDLNNQPVKYLKPGEPREITFDLKDGLVNGKGQLCKTITIVIPNGVVQEKLAPIARVNPAQATTTMLHMITKEVKGFDFLNPGVFKKMTKRDRDYVSQKLNEFEAGIDLTVHTMCAECGAEFDTVVPVGSLLGE